MFPGNKLRIFARQGYVTFERDSTAVFRQAGKIRHQHVVGRRQHDQVVAAIVLVNADDIEQVHGERDQVGVVVLFFNALCELLGFFTTVGVDLQQAVAALF